MSVGWGVIKEGGREVGATCIEYLIKEGRISPQ